LAALEGTEEWEPDDIARRIAFLVDCADHSGNLSLLLGSTAEAYRALPRNVQRDLAQAQPASFAAQLYTRAGELAFATGDLAQGRECFQTAIDLLLNLGANPKSRAQPSISQFVKASELVAVIGSGKLELSDKGLRLVIGNLSFSLLWSRDTQPSYLGTVLPTLLLAVAATGGGADVPEVLLSPDQQPSLRFAISSASTKTEFMSLGFLKSVAPGGEANRLIDFGLNRSTGSAAVREMEREYRLRIHLLRRDSYHWSSLRPKAELLDLRLLLIQIALFRHENRVKHEVQAEAREPVSFLWELASQLSN
jgi:hypothetical protein